MAACKIRKARQKNENRFTKAASGDARQGHGDGRTEAGTITPRAREIYAGVRHAVQLVKESLKTWKVGSLLSFSELRLYASLLFTNATFTSKIQDASNVKETMAVLML